MKNSLCTALLFLFSFSNLLIAQINKDDNETLVTESIENAAEEIDQTAQTELPDEILELSKQPLNLNSDDLSVLVRYNLITEIQQQSLVEYIKHSGALIEVEELQQVAGFDKKTIMSILPFVTVLRLKNIPVSHQLTFRFQQSLLKQESYYPGSPAKMLFRFKSTISSHLKFSIISEKDAGEEIFTKHRPAFDFTSFSLMYTGNSNIKKIILGDYNIEFGQGLNAWTGLGFSGGSSITSIYKTGRGIIPYSGTDENRFMRGIAANYASNLSETTCWFSYHGIDGNNYTDSATGEKYITSFQNSGYHRTYSEISDKHALKETAYGITRKYTLKNGSIGLILSGQHYNIPILKNDNPYAMLRFNGKDNINLGPFYSIRKNNLVFFGEASLNEKLTSAFLTGVIISASQKLSIGILYRRYPENFHDLKSEAFGTNTDNANETGTWIGINYKIKNSIVYSAYSDVCKFPFLKYKVDRPSYSTDFMQQVDFTPNRKTVFQLRYRNRMKQGNSLNPSDKLNSLVDNSTTSIRVSARFKFEDGWEYGVRCETSIQKSENNPALKGTLISQDIFYKPMGKSYSFNFRYSVFSCPDFDSRIYSYENDVSGAFSVPFYYGIGSKFYINFSKGISRRISLATKYTISWIKDANGKINQPSEIKIQMKFSFS